MPGRSEHPRAQADLQSLELRPLERLEEPQLGLRRCDRGGLQQAHRRRRHTRGASEHRVADRRGNRRSATGRQHFGDEERIAGGLVEQVGFVDAVRRGQRRDGVGGQRVHAQPADRVIRGELTQQHAEWMRTFELVAVRHDDQRPHRLDPSCDETQHVQRRLVGPVDVLDDHDRRGSRLQRRHQGVGDLVRSATAVHLGGGLAGKHRGDVEERTQRTGREQRIAGTPHDVDAVAVRFAEGPDQGGLPDAGLSAEQDQPATSAPRHCREVLFQGVQLPRSLEQHVVS